MAKKKFEGIEVLGIDEKKLDGAISRLSKFNVEVGTEIDLDSAIG
jgi:hypothetical protein